MLRFSHAEIDNSNGVHINENVLYMDNNIWSNCKLLLSECNIGQGRIIDMIPVKDAGGELIAYGYQDNEANREFRMLRELRENEHALQFTDIFPEYKEVLILGCNELAVTFAKYLKEIGVDVSVIGQYWNYYGYENCDQKNLSTGETVRKLGQI